MSPRSFENEFTVSGKLQKILDLDGSTPEPAIRSGDTGQRIPCVDSCQLMTTLICNQLSPVGRSVGHVITNFLGWVDLFTHGAPLLRYNDLFTRPLKFSLFYLQFHAIFLRITPSMESLHILSGPFFIFLQDKVS